jgi:hypothetical protein
MSDWTHDPTTGKEQVPGKLDPPPPDQVLPTDDGWAQWISKLIKDNQGPTGPNCKVSVEITPTGQSQEVPVEGSNPDDFRNATHGWKKDSVKVNTLPPAVYKDFRRWSRHYKSLWTQNFQQYKVTIRVECADGKRWWTSDWVWKPLGPKQETGPRTVYRWVQTSGLREADGPNGKITLQWEDDDVGPSWEYPDPDPLFMDPKRQDAPESWQFDDFPKIELKPDWGMPGWMPTPEAKFLKSVLPPEPWNPLPVLRWVKVGELEKAAGGKKEK